MNRRFALCITCLALAFPISTAPAAGQTTAKAGQMYEDIEIMSRILDRVLHLPRYETVMVRTAPNNFGAQFGGFGGLSGGIGGLQGGAGLAGGLGGLQGSGFAGNPQGASNLGFSGGGGFHGGQMATVAQLAYPRTQGIYVREHGVVFTVTLPPQRDLKPAPSQPQPKPPTEWEQIRKQLQGEKSEAPVPPQKQPEPSIADKILEALAKNGHYFSQLGDKENLTVSVIFRRADGSRTGRSHAALDYQYFTFGDPATADPAVFQSIVTPDFEDSLAPPKSADQKEKKDQPKNPSGNLPEDTDAAVRAAALRALGGEAGTGSSPRDYELLGDLHLKQGQSKEALEAYRKAADKNRDAQHAAAMYLKMAQIHLTITRDEGEGLKAMNRAREILASLGRSNPEPPKPSKVNSPLSSRLIITVPKKLLVDVATGKMSMPDFKKAAVVEHLSFAEEKKPSPNK